MKKKTKQILMTGVGVLSLSAMAEGVPTPTTLDGGQEVTIKCLSDAQMSQELAKLRKELAATQAELTKANRGTTQKLKDWWNTPSAGYGGYNS